MLLDNVHGCRGGAAGCRWITAFHPSGKFFHCLLPLNGRSSQLFHDHESGDASECIKGTLNKVCATWSDCADHWQWRWKCWSPWPREAEVSALKQMKGVTEAMQAA